MASRLIGQSSACLASCSEWQQRNIKGPCYCSYVKGLHQWSVNYSHEGTVARKIVPFNDVIMASSMHPWTIPTDQSFDDLLFSLLLHYNDVIMGSITSQITSLTNVYSTVHSGADKKKHQSSASMAFVRGIHRGPVNSPHKWPVTNKMFPFDDVIMTLGMVVHIFIEVSYLYLVHCYNSLILREN